MRPTSETYCRALAFAVASVCLTAGSATHAASVVWNGAGGNGVSGTTSVTDINNWLPTQVPGTGDDAHFLFDASTANRTTLGLTNLNAPASATTFAPDGLLRFSDTVVNAATTLTIQKSLTLAGMAVNLNATGGSGLNNRFVLGDASNAITLNLTGTTPFSLVQTSNSDTAAWTAFRAQNVTFNLSNPNISLNTTGGVGQTNGISDGHMGGGLVTITTPSTELMKMNFTSVNGAISISDAGYRNSGTLGLGNTMPVVYSTQTWTSAPTGYIGRNWQQGATAAGPYLVDSADGAPLNNLDQVNFMLQEVGASATSSTIATGMQLRPGEYGSLFWIAYQGISSSRDRFLNATGDIAFKGNAVKPGTFANNSTYSPGVAIQATTTPYGLVMQSALALPSGSGPLSAKVLNLAGYNLTIDNGVSLEDHLQPTAANSDNSSQAGSAVILANGSGLSQIIRIGGDLRFDSLKRGSAARALDDDSDLVPNVDHPDLGISGGVNGVTLSIGGSFTTNLRALQTSARNASGTNLRFSTVKMTGSNVTWEVGDAASLSAIPTANTFYMNRFEVGDGVNPASLKLVNAHLNDNPIALGGDPNVAKLHEQLAVGTLAINANSSLDVDNLDVLVAIALQIAPTGSIDLNSGAARSAGYRYEDFVGIGDQTATWNALASYVSDSDSPGMGVQAILYGDGNTYWEAVVPEPTSLGLLSTLGAGLLARRRRNG